MTAHRLLHVIHDFLPVHRAGAEIYVAALCRALAERHHVTVLTTDYDPARRHGEVAWREFDGFTVVEIVNNWEGASFEDSYRPAMMTDRIAQLLDTLQPHVVHLHSVLNLSMDLPAQARARGSAVVATLHDYTLVCPSGGQRVHRAEAHVCHEIDVDRCARCFPETVFQTKLSIGRVAQRSGSLLPLRRMAAGLVRHAPVVARAAARAARHAAPSVTPEDVSRRLDAARTAIDHVDLFVSPSASMAAEYCRLGVPTDRMRVSDYGFPAQPATPREPSADGRLRVGYVGTLVWHKGVHVLIEALRRPETENVRLLVFGDPRVSPEYAGELRQMAAGLPVEFMGPFEPGQRAAVYASFDVLAVPSLWLENSPLVVHEAFAAAMPVIGSRIGGITGLIDDRVNGLLAEPGSSSALAAAMGLLARDRALLERLTAHRPAIKTIEEDAAEWEARYAEVLR